MSVMGSNLNSKLKTLDTMEKNIRLWGAVRPFALLKSEEADIKKIETLTSEINSMLARITLSQSMRLGCEEGKQKK